MWFRPAVRLLHIHNLKGLTIEEVAVYDLTDKLINRFPLNSRENLALPIDAQNALLLVRIATEQGVTVYKVYLANQNPPPDFNP